MRINRAFSLLSTFALASGATFVVVTNAYGDASHPTQVTGLLLALIAIQGLVYGRLRFSRELLVNLAFVSYELLSLSWTEYVKTATNTLPAIINSTLVLILYTTLVAYHNLRALLGGMFIGFLAAAALYSLTSGFPLTYPEDFSYNTIAGMYLSGLFITLVFGTYIRSTILPLVVGAVLLVLIAATTSIKTNLGIALGLIGAGLLYFRFSINGLVKSAIVLAALGGAMSYAVLSNQALTDRVQNGFARVSTGFAVLTNREGDSGGIGLGTRQGWQREGLKGWVANPVFGNGVEGFRADFGITSHSTPIDLLYNSGLIGFTCFYAMLASIGWRLMTARNPRRRDLRSRIAVFWIAYSFISLSGIIYYDQFFYIFIALGAGLLVRLDESAAGEAAAPVYSVRSDFGSAAKA